MILRTLGNPSRSATVFAHAELGRFAAAEEVPPRRAGRIWSYIMTRQEI
jgi:hypothetical protein